MEIRSNPATTSETVTDLEIAFLYGENLQIQLRGPEGFSCAENVMTITKTSPSGQITVYMAQVTWWSVRERIVVSPVKTKGAAPEPKG